MTLMTTEVGHSKVSASAGAMALVVGTLASIYMISQFLRNSVGVIAPNLAAEVGLSASEIGLLASSFFITFAAAQLPLGVALDRFGPRRCMLVCAAIVIVASGVFASATTPFGLIAGRALLGLGSSCYLMAPLALYARRYPPDRFAMLAGIQLGVGSIGALVATAPLAYSAAALGWRMTFALVGAIMLVGAILLMLVIREDATDKEQAAHTETLGESIAGIIEAIRAPSVWRLFLLHLAAYSSFATIIGLWGGPYLTHVYGYDLRGRGDVLLLAAVAQVLAMMLWGHTDRLLRSYKIPVLGGSLATALVLGLAAFAGTFSTWQLIAWFIALGALCAYTPVLIAHGKSLFEPRLVGRGMTILNMGTMGGAFLTQALTGFVMDLFPAEGGVYPLAAYRTVFAFQALILVLACATYIKARDPWRG